MFVVNVLSRITILFWSLLLALILVQFSFAAGSGAISGYVVDKSTGDPLIGTNVIVINTSLVAASKVDGKCSGRSCNKTSLAKKDYDFNSGIQDCFF